MSLPSISLRDLSRYVPSFALAALFVVGPTRPATAQAGMPAGTKVHLPTASSSSTVRPMVAAATAGEAPALPSGVLIAASIAGDTGGYHYGSSLLCSDCHAAHFSMAHGFDGGGVASGGAPDGNWLGAVGPNWKLLKSPSSTELCLECHDGKSFAPDVLGADSNGLAQRSAGSFAALETTNFMGHDLSVDPDAGLGGFSALCSRCHFSGTMATAKVQCIDCHNPHGNVSFRNLWWASDPGGEPPLVAYLRPGVTGLARYEEANVAYPAPAVGVGSWREVTNMCIDCHHAFFSSWYTNATSPFIRHPGLNSEANAAYPIDRPGANTDPAFWVGGEGSFLVPRLPFAVRGATDFATATTVASDNQVFCLTCHRAHGSQNPFGLRWDYSSAGSPTGADGCFQCHRQVLTGG